MTHRAIRTGRQATRPTRPKSREPANLRPAPLVLAIHLALMGGATALAGWSPAAQAQGAGAAQPAADAAKRYDIPAGPLGTVLSKFSVTSGVLLAGSSELVQGRNSPGLSGSYTPEAAVKAMLSGTGLTAVRQTNGTYSLQTAPVAAAPAATPSSESVLPIVKVTASTVTESAYGPVSGYVAKRSATGTKTDTPIIETPQSISVVSAERIEAIGAANLKEALVYTPGVDVAPYGSDSRYDWITVRGMDAYSPGFYLDGLPMRNVGGFAVWRNDTYSTERLEVLRGPSSVLYGQGNPGGVVNIVSKLPSAEPVRELQAQVGDPRRNQMAADFSGPLNGDGSVLYRLTGVLRDGQLPVGGMKDDYAYLAPSITWKPSVDTSLTVLSQFGHIRSGVYTRGMPAYGSLLPTAIGTRIPTSTYAAIPGFDHYDQDQWLLGYQLEHRLDDIWTVRQSARYSTIKSNIQQLSFGSFVTVDEANTLDPANFKLLSRTPFSSMESAKSFVIDNQAEARVDLGEWRHTLLLGLEYQNTRFDQVSTWGGDAPPLNLAAPTDTGAVTNGAAYVDALTRARQTGLYVQDQIKWRDRWAITLGGRYDKSVTNTDDRLGTTNTRQEDGKFTKRAGLVYLVPNGMEPYVSYTESFSPSGVVNPATGTGFAPETGRQYETGLRYQPPGQKQSYSLAVFDLRRQNYITYDANYVPSQIGAISVRGLELEAAAALTSRLNATLAYGYTPRAIVTASADPSQIGKQAMAVPRNRLSLWTDYRFENGLKIGLGAHYNGSTRGNNEAAPAQVPGYTVYDAMLGYAMEHWNFALNVQNLADKAYIATCADASCYYGTQRKMVFTTTYRW